MDFLLCSSTISHINGKQVHKKECLRYYSQRAREKTRHGKAHGKTHGKAHRTHRKHRQQKQDHRNHGTVAFDHHTRGTCMPEFMLGLLVALQGHDTRAVQHIPEGIGQLLHARRPHGLQDEEQGRLSRKDELLRRPGRGQPQGQRRLRRRQGRPARPQIRRRLLLPP